MIIQITNRLIIRDFRIDDAIHLYNLNQDPEVLQFTGDNPFQSINDAKIFIEGYDQYSKYGFGRWAVLNKKDREFLGWCGLKYSSDVNEYDIGFRFFKKHWKNGYASESAEACLKLGFIKFNIPVILGRAMARNTASIKVLEKIQMKYLKPFDFNGNEGVIYYSENDVYLSKS